MMEKVDSSVDPFACAPKSYQRTERGGRGEETKLR